MSTNSRSVTTAGTIAASETPKRAVFCFFGLGINGRDFTPADTGLDYTLSPILEPLAELRKDFTVVSGLRLTHSGGHVGDRTFLTGTNTRSAGAKLRISCDQELAPAVGRQTRFPSLVLGIRRGTGFGGNQDQTLSWTSAGTPLPSESRPHILFDQLFRPDTADTLQQREAEFIRRTSILDSLREEACRLNNTLGSDDQQKLNEYLTGIRDLERRMQDEKDWLRKPKPNVETLNFGKEQGLDPDKAGLVPALKKWVENSTARSGRKVCSFKPEAPAKLPFDETSLALQASIVGENPGLLTATHFFNARTSCWARQRILAAERRR